MMALINHFSSFLFYERTQTDLPPRARRVAEHTMLMVPLLCAPAQRMQGTTRGRGAVPWAAHEGDTAAALGCVAATRLGNGRCPSARRWK